MAQEERMLDISIMTIAGMIESDKKKKAVYLVPEAGLEPARAVKPEGF